MIIIEIANETISNSFALGDLSGALLLAWNAKKHRTVLFSLGLASFLPILVFQLRPDFSFLYLAKWAGLFATSGVVAFYWLKYAGSVKAQLDKILTVKRA